MKEGVVHTIKLSVPVKVGDLTIEQLEFRACKAKHFRDMPGEPQLGDLFKAVGRLTGQPPNVIDELAIADAMLATEYVSTLFTSGQPTGSSASAD